jgi:hypothetical protein
VQKKKTKSTLAEIGDIKRRQNRGGKADKLRMTNRIKAEAGRGKA